MTEEIATIDLAELVNPTAKQRQLFSAVYDHKFTLFGGARGGSKSYSLRWLAIVLLLHWAGQGYANVRVGVFCEDYPTLYDRQISRAEIEFPSWLGTWHKSTPPEFRLHEKWGGGVICFRNLDKSKVATESKYQSAEFAAILVDELTKNTVDKFTVLRGSLRWPGIHDTKFVAGTNPGSIGHHWVKDVWIDGTFALPETKPMLSIYKKSHFAYVKATAYDNPHNSPTYLAELEALPQRLKRAWLYGDWDVFEGMAFDEWVRDVHVVPNRVLAPRDGWRYVAGLDWGYRKGYYGLFALGPDGDVELVWEFAPSVAADQAMRGALGGSRVGEQGFTHLHGYAAAQTIARRSTRFPVPEAIYYDDQMDQDAGLQAGTTIKTEFLRGLWDVHGGRENAPRMEPAVKGKGSRKIKYDLFHQYLDWGRGDREAGAQLALIDPTRDVSFGNLLPWLRPRFRIQDRCRYAASTIPALPVDPDSPDEDVDTDAEDHGYDGICNVLLMQPPLPEKRGATVLPDRHPGWVTRKTKIVKRKPDATDVEQEAPSRLSPFASTFPSMRYPRERVPSED